MFIESSMNLDRVLNSWNKFVCFLSRKSCSIEAKFLGDGKSRTLRTTPHHLKTLSLLPSQIAWVSNLKSSSTKTGSCSWVHKGNPWIETLIILKIVNPRESSNFPTTRYIYSNDMTCCHLFHHLPVLRMATYAIIAIPQATKTAKNLIQRWKIILFFSGEPTEILSFGRLCDSETPTDKTQFVVIGYIFEEPVATISPFSWLFQFSLCHFRVNFTLIISWHLFLLDPADQS